MKITEIELNEKELNLLQYMYSSENNGKIYLTRDDLKQILQVDETLTLLVRFNLITKTYKHPRYRYSLNKNNELINKNYPSKFFNIKNTKLFTMSIDKLLGEIKIDFTLNDGTNLYINGENMSYFSPKDQPLIRKLINVAKELRNVILDNEDEQ